jgi:flagellar biosynthesis chaperone FliJ
MKYPLSDLLTIKIKRFEQAVKNFEEKTQKLLKERETLFQLEKVRNKVLNHKNAKLQQLRNSLDKGEATNKIRQKKTYLKVVQEDLDREEEKVKKQKKVVKEKEKELEEAKKVLFEKKKQVEKLEIHQKEWKLELQKINKKIEALQLDEIGSNIFISRRKKK